MAGRLSASRNELVEIAFLTLDEVVAIHRDQIERYGGSLGVRDWGLLRSAIAMPAATFGGRFLHADVWEMASAYLFHIVQNHPFIDGNKRVGAVAANVFFAINNIRLDATDDDYAELVLSVARGETGKSGIAEFFRTNTTGGE
jgi:death-on-curing protein